MRTVNRTSNRTDCVTRQLSSIIYNHPRQSHQLYYYTQPRPPAYQYHRRWTATTTAVSVTQTARPTRLLLRHYHNSVNGQRLDAICQSLCCSPRIKRHRRSTASLRGIRYRLQDDTGHNVLIPANHRKPCYMQLRRLVVRIIIPRYKVCLLVILVFKTWGRFTTVAVWVSTLA